MIKLKAIVPKKFIGLSKAEAEMTEALNEVAKDIKDDFAKTVATWTDKPDFTIEKAREGELRAAVWTDNEIYRYLNFGTRVRYATMTPDFAPKTRRRVIGSGKGRGGVAFISRRRPRPGIEAREFDITIAEKNKPILEKAIENALRRAVQ